VENQFFFCLFLDVGKQLFAFEKTLPRSPSEYRFNAGSEFFIVKPENIIPRKPNFFEKVLDNGK